MWQNFTEYFGFQHMTDKNDENVCYIDFLLQGQKVRLFFGEMLKTKRPFEILPPLGVSPLKFVCYISLILVIMM